MGHEKFMGYGMDAIWLDEEPDMQIFTQCITRTADREGMLYMTFTPEAGMTEVVIKFIEDLKPGQYIRQAGWDDAPHLTEEVKTQLLSVYPPYEREMRSKGEPIFGSGLVFPVHVLEDILIEPIPLPAHFPRIIGLDFGWEHYTASCWGAVDRESDKIYLYDEYFDKLLTPEVHAAAIQRRGPNIPVSWPKDGLITEKGSGDQLAGIYRTAGLNMLPFHFTNAPTAGNPKGGVSVEAGTTEIYQMMEQHRLLIFNTLLELPRQIRKYHRQDGKIVNTDDDMISAMRYAVCARRHAKTSEERKAWGLQELDYTEQLKGIV
jgi:phage terminase large subunit-like protein